MKKKIALLFLAASFAFVLFIPTQLPADAKISSYLAQHGG